PFTRADAAFGAALEAAWRATRSPSLSARWAVISDRTGAALEVIEGRSVGAGAALALRYLSCSDLPPLDPSWAITGAVDATGALCSLLEDDHNLATYRTKLVAAGNRKVVVPRSDHPHIVGLVESGGVKASLLPAANVGEIVEAAASDLVARSAYDKAMQRGPKARWRAGAAVTLFAVVAGAAAYLLFSGGDWPTRSKSTSIAPASVPPGTAVAEGSALTFHFDGGIQADAQGGRFVTDSSGSRRGYEDALTGGRVEVVDHPGQGRALTFPPPCDDSAPICRRAIIDVADVAFLNPGAEPFAYGADLLVAPNEATPGANILQKGFATAASSQWKLEMAGEGKPRCVLVARNTGTVYRAESTVTVADGAWHRVACTRAATALSIQVDATAPRVVPLPEGLVIASPGEPLRLGGSTAHQTTNRFSGGLDNVYYRLG
ncbi:MAG: hypothetical protein LC733_13570, partial [Actinobacteria bacterium]|nr:hypothetical protein [Actinomycetota bacterium]